MSTSPDMPAGRPFVGRQRELGQIDTALEDAGAGRGRLLVLAGEPGIGKTSLADRAMEAAGARGFLTLWGRCWEAGGAPAYWPWLDVLGALPQTLPEGRLAELLGDGAALLGALVPEVRARLHDAGAGAATPPADEARFRLWRAALGLLREAARASAAGVAIVLDDLHAADRSSLALLHFVARELRSLRVLFVCTYRDVEARVDPEVGALLARVAREGTVLALPRLDREAAAHFVRERAGAVAGPVEERIVDSTQGNPLFLEEMVRLLEEQGPGSIAAGEVPHGVRDVIRQRLSHLGAEAHALLELGAVAGDQLDPPLLAAASGQDPAAIAARLEEATRAGVLVARDAGGRRRFGHALFREVLYRELGDEARRALHGQVAEALGRLAGPGAPPHAELAHHALRGPRELLAPAVDHAVRAAARAQDLAAYDDAVQILTAARGAVEAAGNPPALRARLLVVLGEACIRRGEVPAGQAHCREASALARALGDPALAATAALTYGRVFTFGNADPVLVEMLEEALEALPPADSALRARLLARLGAALQPSPRMEEPIAVAREAIEIARRLGDRVTLLEVLHDGISALMDVAPPLELRALNLEAERLAQELGDRERLLRTHGRLALTYLALGELAAADAQILAYEELAAALRAPWYAWRGHLLRGMRATMSGRFAEAAQLADEGLRVARAGRDPTAERVFTTHREAWLRAGERHDDMLAFEPQSRRGFAGFQHATEWQAVSSALIHARLEDLPGVRRELQLMPLATAMPFWNLFWLFFLAEGAALVGPRDAAAELHARMRALPDEYVVLGMSYMSWEGPKARLLALLDAYLERWDDAFAGFEDAAARCRRLDARPLLARVEYEHARARLARGAPGDDARAAELLGAALVAAAALEMPGLARLAEARLAEARARGAGAPAAAPAATAAAPGAPPPFTFTLEGEYWTVVHAEATFRLKDSLGLRYLVRLIGEPDREVHVLDLVGDRAGGAANEVIDAGDAGELIDAEARASYGRRLEDLREALAEAEAFGDGARAARAREEIEALGAELGRAVGLGGRARRAGGAAERARSAVQRRIKNALDRIAEHAPGLAAHLGRAVKTGTFCAYRPEAAR
jgi:hypothetical protein